MWRRYFSIFFCSSDCGVGAACARRGEFPAIAPRNIPSTTKRQQALTGSLFLWNKFLRDRERPPGSKRPRSYFKARSGLFALVFGAVHKSRNVAHQLYLESVFFRNLLRTLQILDVGPQNSVQHIVRRQAAFVLLVRPQFRRGRLFNRRAG